MAATCGEAVDGNALIRDIMRRLQHHVVLTPAQALTVALWIMMAWTHAGAAIYSPILMTTSAEADSGKTTLLNLVGFLAPRSLSTVETTGAVLFRVARVSSAELNCQLEPLARAPSRGRTL